MTIAYGVKTSKVPLKAIARSLRYPSVELAARDLYLVGAEIFEDETSKEKFARFTKANSPLCKGKVTLVTELIYQSSLISFFMLYIFLSGQRTL